MPISLGLLPPTCSSSLALSNLKGQFNFFVKGPKHLPGLYEKKMSNMAANLSNLLSCLSNSWRLRIILRPNPGFQTVSIRRISSGYLPFGIWVFAFVLILKISVDENYLSLFPHITIILSDKNYNICSH